MSGRESRVRPSRSRRALRPLLARSMRRVEAAVGRPYRSRCTRPTRLLPRHATPRNTTFETALWATLHMWCGSSTRPSTLFASSGRLRGCRPPVHAAHPDRARVAVNPARTCEDRVVHDPDAVWDALRSLPADDDRYTCVIARDLGVGTAKHVVHDRHPVDATDEVELGGAEPVDAERVPFDEESVAGPERDEVLMPTALMVHAARESALE